MTVSAAPFPAMSPLDIRHHPSDDLLLTLVTGGLPVGIELVTQTHLELCPVCRERVAMLRAVGGVLLEDEAPAPLRDDALARAFAAIDSLDAMDAIDAVGPSAAATAGAAAAAAGAARAASTRPRRVPAPPPLPTGAVWPRALAHCSATRWRWIGPGMRWSRVTVPEAPEANVFLLRIGTGKYLPPHTHSGTELTQVIYGRFHDGRALFGPGDFDLADGDVHHQPVVQDGSECICIAAVEGRLQFDGLIARWFGSLVGM